MRTVVGAGDRGVSGEVLGEVEEEEEMTVVEVRIFELHHNEGSQRLDGAKSSQPPQYLSKCRLATSDIHPTDDEF